MIEPSVYLDNNATTQCAPEVIEAMLPFFAGKHGNPSSPHLLGRQAALAVSSARDLVADSVGSSPSDIYFTGCATESNNLAILGVTHTTSQRRKIVVSCIEHKSVLGPCEVLAAKGYQIATIPVTAGGLVDLDAAREIIDDSTLLVSVQGANNEIGTIQPVRAVADIAHENGAAFHCDAAQLLGKVPISIEEIGADFTSFSSHKAYGPKGVGVLVVRPRISGVRVLPLLFGGGQESGLRPGTLNVPGIVGAGEACRLCLKNVNEDTERIARMRRELENGILAATSNASVIAATSERLPGTASVMLPTIPADLLIARTPTVCMSLGSACSSGTVTPSHVLLALGFSHDEARCAVRFSLGRYNIARDVQNAVSAISRAIAEISAEHHRYSERLGFSAAGREAVP
jgi:cysteine desulfurase